MTGDVVGDGRLDDRKGRKSATIQALEFQCTESRL